MQPVPFEVATEVLNESAPVQVLTVRGELDLNTAPELEAPLETVLKSGGELVLIDLSDCEFIDSTGIALLVRAWQRVDRGSEGGGSGRFVICCPNQQVRRLLDITGLDSSITMHDGRESALADLRD